jgi:hypothetical protein
MEYTMNRSFSFLMLAVLLSAATMLQAQTNTCADGLFVANDDLHSYGGNQHPCIVSYRGSSANLSSGCTGWAFQMNSGAGFLIIGPTVPLTRWYTFRCIAITTGTVRVSTSTSSGGPWTQIMAFTPSTTTCTDMMTPTIGANMYIKWTQDPQGGGPNGMLTLQTIVPDILTPVQLTSFVAGKVGSRVQLAWKTATEINNFGFDVERKANEAEWETIGFVRGHGTVNTPQSYSFSDAPPATAQGVVSYRLRQIDRDGKTEYSPVVSVTMAAVKTFGLLSAYPNPFNPTTTLSFTLPEASSVTLAIFDKTGREVARLIDNAPMNAGSYSQIFNANRLTSGDYFAWLYTGTESSVMSVSLVK